MAYIYLCFSFNYAKTVIAIG